MLAKIKALQFFHESITSADFNNMNILISHLKFYEGPNAITSNLINFTGNKKIMSRDEIKKLKSTIYKKVDQLNDETFLQMVEEAVTAYSSASQEDMLDELTPDQQQRLQQSIQQADNGNTISNDEVKQKAKEWLFR